MGLGVVAGVDGDGVVECGVFDFVGGVERGRVLRRGGGVAGGVGGPVGARGLGLSGVVEADQLRALVDGRDPNSGVDLLAGCRPRSVLAFDLTFSAPKSVSLLWALGSEPVAEVVAAAHREAVGGGVGVLEERAALARLQSQGVRRRVATGGWVVAGFVHRTSREGDPQLHSHCLVPNLVQRAVDGRHVAFDAGPLFEWARAAGSIYQNHLQRTLSERLGVVLGAGPEQHPGDRRLHPRPAAGLLEAQRPDRGRTGSKGRGL